MTRGQRLTLCDPLPSLSLLVLGELGLPSELHSPSFRTDTALIGSSEDQMALELCEAT